MLHEQSPILFLYLLKVRLNTILSSNNKLHEFQVMKGEDNFFASSLFLTTQVVEQKLSTLKNVNINTRYITKVMHWVPVMWNIVRVYQPKVYPGVKVG